MTMTGIYRIVLAPGTNEAAFVNHMENEVFTATGVLQLTRITSHFAHALLKSQGAPAQYAWVVTVDLVTSAGYDFDQNIDRVQKSIAHFGVLTAVETYTNLTNVVAA